MKTVFLTSFHVLISRNIVAAGIPARLAASGVRVILLVPDYKKEHFERNFSADGIVIEGVRAFEFSKRLRGLFFKRLSQVMLPSETVKDKTKFKLLYERKFFYYFLFVLPFRFFGRLPVVMPFLRWLDAVLAPMKNHFDELFMRYRPSLVVATDLNNENDVALMQSARRKDIRILGIIRSWDQPANHVMRVLPDEFLVQSEAMKELLLRFHAVDPETITIVGVPHYDRYLRGPTMPRQAFFERIHADPGRKLVIYVPIGDNRIRTNDTDYYLLSLLAPLGHTIVVRFPPAAPVNLPEEPPFPNVVYDRPGTSFRHRGDSEMSEADDERLINELSYADLVVSGPGTMNIDAALFNKPIILCDFYPTPRSAIAGIKEYRASHIQPVLASGGVRMAKTPQELFRLMDMYLANPKLDEEGRERIIRLHCHKTDGRAGERVVAAIIKNIH